MTSNTCNDKGPRRIPIPAVLQWRLRRSLQWTTLASSTSSPAEEPALATTRSRKHRRPSCRLRCRPLRLLAPPSPPPPGLPHHLRPRRAPPKRPPPPPPTDAASSQQPSTAAAVSSAPSAGNSAAPPAATPAATTTASPSPTASSAGSFAATASSAAPQASAASTDAASQASTAAAARRHPIPLFSRRTRLRLQQSPLILSRRLSGCCIPGRRRAWGGSTPSPSPAEGCCSHPGRRGPQDFCWADVEVPLLSHGAQSSSHPCPRVWSTQLRVVLRLVSFSCAAQVLIIGASCIVASHATSG